VKIVIAPDSFKESLTAVEVAGAIAAGVSEALPHAEIDLCPMADGGEGTVEAMVAATGGELREADTFDAVGRPCDAAYGMLGDHRTAVIEMAAAAGLEMLGPEKRNPMLTTTFGVGRLIMAALDAGARRMIVGIGGSATTDGGAGCAQALGVIFTDANGAGCVCGLAGGGLADVAGIDMSGRDPRLDDCEIRVACDVTNPLTGPDGAAAVYGPQKGATPEMVASLDAGLANLAEVIRRDLAMDVEHLPGSGAAGGLGAGLVAFAGAALESGVTIVAEAVDLAGRCAGADWVITGEGRFDGQTASGKLPVGVAEIAAAGGAKAICIPGQATPDAPREAFADVRPLVSGDVTLDEALAGPAELLTRRTIEAMRAIG